ncbi:hypothetical protein B0H14DRAFT_2646143 [Mycena olivaceomarginata]|nr:hypothetical protein B0H14DRAFT_2646143 [Mycena olivaceomarginata]
MDRLTDSQNRFTEEGEQFEQVPGGLTKITTDTEDMPSTHTKLLSSPIYTVFVESSQMQSRKKADDIVGTSSSPPQNGIWSGGAGHEKIERKGDKEAQGRRQTGIRAGGDPPAQNGVRKEGETRIESRMKERGAHARRLVVSLRDARKAVEEDAGLLHTYHRPAPLRDARHATLRHRVDVFAVLRDVREWKTSGGEGAGKYTDGMRNAREWADGRMSCAGSLGVGMLGGGGGGGGGGRQGRDGLIVEEREQAKEDGV